MDCDRLKTGGLLLFWIFQLLCSSVLANPFGEKTMQPAWSPQQVDRMLIMPKGWMQLQLSIDSKYSSAQRGLTGDKIPLEADQYWSYSRMWLNFTHAFSTRTMMYMHIPIVRAQFQPSSGDAITTMALGDVHSGVFFQPTLLKHSLALQVDVKSPSGVEWPSGRRGGPSDINGFLTGTGLTNLGVTAHGKVKASQRYAVHLSAGYIIKFPGIVGYVVEENGFGNGILNAGNELTVVGRHLFQVHDDVCLELTHSFSQRGAYKMGVSGEGLLWNLSEEILAPGWFMDAGGAVSWEPTAKRELRLLVSNQIYGSETIQFAALGLEEFSPQPGTTVALQGSIRW